MINYRGTLVQKNKIIEEPSLKKIIEGPKYAIKHRQKIPKSKYIYSIIYGEVQLQNNKI